MVKSGENTSTSAAQQIDTKEHIPFFQKKGQETSANQSTLFFQPKLTIGQPNDKYEQEADAMADRVVGQHNHSDTNPTVQTKCEDCEQEEQLSKKEMDISAIQRKPIFESNDDGQEQGNAPVQRKCSSCGAAMNKKEVRMKSEGATPAVPTNLSSQLSSQKGKGNPLPETTKDNMESSFGNSFDNVRIHTDSPSVEMNQSIGAQAFTHGQDVYFNEGKYQPETGEGHHLLAHELTHVVQQGEAKENNENSLSDLSLRPDIQRLKEETISDMTDKLSYGAFDWAVTDGDARSVIVTLSGLSEKDLKDAVSKLGSTLINRLLENLTSTDRKAHIKTLISIIQYRGASDNYNFINSLLSYGMFDWAITDDEAVQVLRILDSLSGAQFKIVSSKLTEGNIIRLLENVSEADRKTFASTLTKLIQAISADNIYAYINYLLSYGLFDWAITDAEAANILKMFGELTAVQFKKVVAKMTKTDVIRLLSNISEADKKTYAATLVKLIQNFSADNIYAYINDLLTYGLFDWVIRDYEAVEVLKLVNRLTDDQLKVVMPKMTETDFQRLMNNISDADRKTHAGLVSRFTRARGFATGTMFTGTLENETDTGNNYDSLISHTLTKFDISKEVEFVEKGSFLSGGFATLTARVISSVSTHLDNKFKIKIEPGPGATALDIDGEYPIRVSLSSNPKADYTLKLHGQEHGTSSMSESGGDIYELGQPSQTLISNVTLGHESAHLILGLSDEYANASVPSRTIYTDNSLLGNYYNEGMHTAKLKVRHFQHLVDYIGRYLPDRKITIIP